MSEEEKLAAQALQKIRSWRKEETAGRGEGFTPRVAIKYCGGCNPIIERGEVAQRIREELATFTWVSWEEESDVVLIVNGCPTACAERAEIQENAKAALVIRPGEVSEKKKTPGAQRTGQSVGERSSRQIGGRHGGA